MVQRLMNALIDRSAGGGVLALNGREFGRRGESPENFLLLS